MTPLLLQTPSAFFLFLKSYFQNFYTTQTYETGCIMYTTRNNSMDSIISNNFSRSIIKIRLFNFNIFFNPLCCWFLQVYIAPGTATCRRGSLKCNIQTGPSRHLSQIGQITLHCALVLVCVRVHRNWERPRFMFTGERKPKSTSTSTPPPGYVQGKPHCKNKIMFPIYLAVYLRIHLARSRGEVGS